MPKTKSNELRPLPGAVMSDMGVPVYRGTALHGVKTMAVPFGPAAADTETPAYRSVLSPNELVSGFPTATTVHEFIDATAKKNLAAPALGTRTPIINPTTGAVTWTPFVFSTYADLLKSRTDFGCGLQEIYNNVIKGDPAEKWHLALFSINRAEWIIADLGAQAFSVPVVALYDTLGADTTEFILTHADVPIVVATIDKVPLLLSLAAKTPKLKSIIAINPLPTSALKVGVADPLQMCKQWAAEKGIALFSFEDVLAIGAKKPIPFRPPTPNDTFCLCYTSGTTGNPKGAVITHANMMAVQRATHMAYGINNTDVHISYLPLAHIFERVVMTSVLGVGGSVGFFRGDVALLIEDMGLLRPTLFPSVPRLLNRIYDRITQQALHSGSAVKAALFQRALDSKIANLRTNGSLTHSIWDPLVFAKAQALLGGRVRLIVSASAPITGEVMEFLRVVFACQVQEAYGQTETTGGLTSTWAGDYARGNVGPCLPCNEVKLVSVPEMNYHAKENKGEIWVRGPNVFSGYLKDEKKTRETITEDGWLMTGDIGVIDARGRVSIVDRKKNIFKLAQGEYIAPEKIENSYLKSALVAQIFVHGDSLQSELVAVVVPDPEMAVKWGVSKGLLPASTPLADVVRQPGQAPHPATVEICAKKEFKDAVLADMTAIGKADKLLGFEFVKAIHLEPNMFSIETGLLTPTFKLKRNEAAIVYREQINAMYKERDAVKPPAKL
ncbi:hypothetical protein BC831DRAFT_472173 [Entophlyctis helioformis]|nr:hypothetical protein BC831DRAFT_472173 [Entophlyctis helioformis]